jgi:GNAT superfamily N-acetyltransferase
MTTDADREYPVTGVAALRITDDPRVEALRFTVVTDGSRCSVLALDDLIAVGSLRWWIREPNPAELEAVAAGEEPVDPAPGEIMYVYVQSDRRRQGIANAMLRVAGQYAEHYGIPLPRHSGRRTEEGDQWARADGAQPASEIVAAEDLHAGHHARIEDEMGVGWASE